MHENAFQGEEVTFLNQTKPQWRTFADKTLVNGISRVTYTFATSSLNPNFPPRTGLARGLPNNDFGYDKRSWISVTGIVVTRRTRRAAATRSTPSRDCTTARPRRPPTKPGSA